MLRPRLVPGEPEVLYERILPCENLNSFYYTVSTMTNKPEATQKRVISKGVSNAAPMTEPITSKNNVNLKNKKHILEIEPTVDDAFKEPFGFYIKTYYDGVEWSGERRQYGVRLERQIIILDKQLCRQFWTVQFEEWDFYRNIVKVTPGAAKSYEGRASSEKYMQLLAYTFEYLPSSRSVKILASGIKGLDEKFLPRFQKIVEQLAAWFIKPSDVWQADHITDFPRVSLKYCDRSDYFRCAMDLKKEFLKPVSQLWKIIKEPTDPLKFIPEDLNIAAYLQSLHWDEEVAQHELFSENRNFVDVGCGNGLLAFLLKRCGWEGYGLDARPRKMWQHLPGMENSLKVMSLNSSNISELQGINNHTIIIGNHPDELSCLIPIITKKMGASCFVLIPCCAYDEYGKKFARVNSTLSVYENFVHFLKEFSESLGFTVKIDKLRIPSTKKLALYGRIDVKNLPAEETLLNMERLLEEIKRIETERAEKNIPPPGTVPPPMNCTQFPRDVTMSLNFVIFEFILKAEIFPIRKEGYVHTWNGGGQSVKIQDLVQHLGEKLQILKSQNKGLQTFLRNSPDIFTFVDGFVRLRVPNRADVTKKIAEGKEDQLRKKNCFFSLYHPDKCPLEDEDCTFQHNSQQSP